MSNTEPSSATARHPDARVVVTGHTADGGSVVTADQQVPHYETPAAGSLFHVLWGVDILPNYPDGGRSEEVAPFPPVGGIRLVQTIVLPDSETDFDSREVAGLSHEDGGHAGMHATASLDLVVIIDGTVVMILGDGTEVELHQGDSVVQNGTVHAWRNRTGTPARLAVIVVGTQHAALSH